MSGRNASNATSSATAGGASAVHEPPKSSAATGPSGPSHTGAQVTTPIVRCALPIIAALPSRQEYSQLKLVEYQDT